jgi:release factor glutamine methyltransferase
VDVVCANLPYIPSQTYQNLDVARYEPNLALDGGGDGMRLIERLLADLAQRHLCQALALLELESSQGQAARTLAAQFFPQAEVSVLQDLAGHDRLLAVVMR